MIGDNILSIRILYTFSDSITHSHEANFTCDDDNDVNADDALYQYLLLMRSVFGEQATKKAIQNLNSPF